jgi:aryl-alcohol dehydrogenase-like predicted oxidoreductase
MIFGSKVDEVTAIQIIQHAVNRGVNFIDTANMYGKGRSEEIVGKAIAGMRDDIVLATKVRHRMGPGPNDEGLSRKHILHAVEASLRRLRTDYIDILYVHRPSNADFGVGYVGDPVPMRETLSALTDLVRSGKVRYLGCSNFPAWLHCKALWTSDQYQFERYVVSQPVYNLLTREVEREILPFCLDQGVGIVPYSPLAGGALTGKYHVKQKPPVDSRGATWGQQWFTTSGFDWADIEHTQIIDELRVLCAERDQTMAQIALGWLLAHPAITAPIIGVSSLKQLQDNLTATEIHLDSETLEHIDRIASPEGPYYT